TFTSSSYSKELSIIQSEDTKYFSFAPASAWMQVEDDACNGTSEHSTLQSGASVTLIFNGDRVALYGSYGPDSAAYSTQLDDGPVRVMKASGRLNYTVHQQLLFTADSLDRYTSHNITLTALSRGKLAVDYAEVDATRTPTG
ncbi:hypothetical protein EV715DRAFT_184379, partial [Schizophyllum commune]